MKSKAERVTALDLKPAEGLSESTRKYFDLCVEKLGLLPNVLKAYAFDEKKLKAFTEFYNELMLGDSGLSKLEREMIAVAVSAINHCHYCLAAHGSAVRQLSGDPGFGEEIAHNWRGAKLDQRQSAMLGFVTKLTEEPDKMTDLDRQVLRDAGFSDRDIWDIAAVAAFFNMSNRVASATDMKPNAEYHSLAR